MPTVELTPFTKAQWLDNSGLPLAGGMLFTFAAGTSTPIATYTDSTGSTPNPNPVVLDAAGRADVWLNAGTSYKLVMQNSLGVQLWTEDGVNPGATPASLGVTNVAGNFSITQPTVATAGTNQSSFSESIQAQYWNGSSTATDQWTLQDVLGAGTNPTSTLALTHTGSSGASTFSIPGNFTVGGAISFRTFENVRYADQFPGADMAAKIAAAYTDLPATGGIVDAGAFQGAQTWATNPFAGIAFGSAKGLYLKLGNVNISCSVQVVIQSSNVYVMGLGWQQTSITYTGGAISSFWKIGTLTPTVNQLVGVKIFDLQISGNANTADALFITGCHHSYFSRLDLRNCTGAGLHTQFAVVNSYDNIQCSNNNGAFTQQPANGMLFDQIDATHQTTASTVNNPIVEGVSGSGIKLTGTEGMLFLAGTSEGNSRGVEVTISVNNRNTFDGLDLETNATEDILDAGVSTEYRNLFSTGLIHLKGAQIRVIGGNNNSYQIDASANNAYIDSSWNFNGTGTVLDNGAETRWRLTDPVAGSLQNTVSGSFGAGAGTHTPGWSFRDIIPLTTTPVGGMDRMDMLRGSFQFTTGGNVISTTPVASAIWRIVFIGLWSNTFEGAGLVQPAMIQEVTAASPTLTIGTQVVTFTRNGSNQFVGTSTANVIGFSGTIFVSSSTVGVAGAASAIFKGSVIAPGLPQVIASGTAAMTTALIGAGAAGATVTVAATGTLSTDAIMHAFNAAITNNPGVLILHCWVTAGNVNFAYFNPTAAGVTPTAATVNWRVIR